MIVGIGIRCFIAIRIITHPLNRHNLRSAIIADVNKEVCTLISARIYSDMCVAVFIVTKDYKVTRGKLASINIRRTRSDFLNRTSICEFTKSCLPSDNRLRVHTRRIDGVQDKLSICTLNIGKIVAHIVGYKRCTTKSLFLKGCNIGCFACYSRTVCDCLFAGCTRSVVNIRSNGFRTS